jgi:hypothetical protein
LTSWKVLTVFAAALAVSPVAYPKGIFQAEGKIAQLERRGDAIMFRFVGTISFGYATAPDADPRRRWKHIAWEAADVAVYIGEWTQPFKPSKRADHPETERIYATLSELMKTGHGIQFSVDNPSLSFSNVGQLMRVSATFIYPRGSDR